MKRPQNIFVLRADFYTNDMSGTKRATGGGIVVTSV